MKRKIITIGTAQHRDDFTKRASEDFTTFVDYILGDQEVVDDLAAQKLPPDKHAAAESFLHRLDRSPTWGIDLANSIGGFGSAMSRLIPPTHGLVAATKKTRDAMRKFSAAWEARGRPGAIAGQRHDLVIVDDIAPLSPQTLDNLGLTVPKTGSEPTWNRPALQLSQAPFGQQVHVSQAAIDHLQRLATGNCAARMAQLKIHAWGSRQRRPGICPAGAPSPGPRTRRAANTARSRRPGGFR